MGELRRNRREFVLILFRQGRFRANNKKNCVRHTYLYARRSRSRANVIRRRGDHDIWILISPLRSSVVVAQWKSEVYDEYFSCFARRAPLAIT